MNDKSIMPFGVHKGKALANVPSDYLLWLYNENKLYGGLRQYVVDNMDVLKADVKRTKSFQAK